MIPANRVCSCHSRVSGNPWTLLAPLTDKSTKPLDSRIRGNDAKARIDKASDPHA